MKDEDMLMYVLTIIAAIICIMFLFNLNPWLFILGYWVFTVIRNMCIIRDNKIKHKEHKEEEEEEYTT